ncbi:A24 family peptidase [Phenylobacterium sp.]|uniref:prepilin peptidase n=1 Tax=Phenylobacterium sp. TaxID=1871053 RepID=UPI0030F46337
METGLQFGVAGLLGLVLGSYVVTAAIRRSRGEATARGRSHCDACGVSLSYAQTVPVISFVGLRGACRSCGDRIDPTHLAGELAGAAILVSAVWIGEPVRVALLSALGLTLLASAVVDARTQRLPDTLTAVIAALTIVLALTRSLQSLEVGLVAGALTFAVLSGVRWLSARNGRAPGLGFGDVKLLSALAIWLGLATPSTVVVAALIGLAVMIGLRPADRRLPFGPMIAASAWTVGILMEAGLWPTMA